MTKVWNCHLIRPTKNQNSPSGRPVVLYTLPRLFHATSHMKEVDQNHQFLLKCVTCISYFYARCLLYHNEALPYKAFKCKIQKNIDSLLPLQHGGRSSDVIPDAREESVSLNPSGMANVGLHS